MKLFIVLVAIVLFFMIQYACSGRMYVSEPRFVVYGSMRCGFTVKMLDYLRGAGESVRFVDVNTSAGDVEFKHVTIGKHIRGVPYTIDNNTKKGIRGFQEIIL